MTKRVRFSLALLPAATFALAVACGKSQRPTFDSAEQAAQEDGAAGEGANDGAARDEEPPQERPKQIENEAQAMKVLLVAATNQIAEGEAVRSRVTNDHARALAEKMISDHTASKARVEALLEKKDIRPQSSRMSDFMSFLSRSAVMQYRSLNDDMIDGSYVSGVIRSLDNLRRAIDEDLTPIVVDEDLAAEVALTKKEVADHVIEAREVETAINASKNERDAGAPPPPEGGAEEDAGAPPAEPAEGEGDAG
ncbi:MAG: DUF4142 domain-containing protein [Labilithrix sp.]|nr:DUF4142 domain-containing protein [Labilithrix sp.]